MTGLCIAASPALEECAFHEYGEPEELLKQSLESKP